MMAEVVEISFLWLRRCLGVLDLESPSGIGDIILGEDSVMKHLLAEF